MHTILRNFLFTCMLGVLFTLSAYSQKAAVKTNLLYWATTSPNLQLEFALGKKTTLELGAGFNPFILKRGTETIEPGVTMNRESKVKHWLFQPELRYWPCEVFNGHFFGIHGHGAQFNIGGVDIPVGRLKKFKDNRYQGYLYGAGISWGYQWVLNPSWNIEFSVGGGYARVHYDKYPCSTCGTKLNEGVYNYFGVTKASLSVVYFIK